MRVANVVIELALSPKSNSAYLAIKKVLEDIDTGRCGNPPDHIKTNSKDYKYPYSKENQGSLLLWFLHQPFLLSFYL